ncbi:acyltransferase family protein [Corynebacterium pacaense]|uniref:acyltransferase family protein n=1 Tax=Corynebacterium pacaense TaxID=1816684 RepID=UPI0009BA89B1|nr:acyltransferase [Corynebacterium pacaense]
MSTQSYPPPVRGGFISSLEGLRAVAALGVLATHAAFQTGVDPATDIGGVLARFDYFVAVFFALSAFLLWRRRGEAVGRYYLKRAARILPAYWVTVFTVLLFVPGGPWLANLTMTQIYVTDGLMTGLTHLWSLCVEVSFYVVMPLLAAVLDRLPQRVRIAAIVGAAVLSLGWAFVPVVEASIGRGWPNMQIWPPAYACWFAVGMLAAEAEGMRFPRVPRAVWWALALGVAWMAGREWFGPLGLTHPAPGEFVRRVLAGTAFAALIVVPHALDPRSRWLSSPVMLAMGRWSYSIFLWHLPVMGIVFPLLGLELFSGGFMVVFAATVLITVPVAAVSHALVEEPVMRWIRTAVLR